MAAKPTLDQCKDLAAAAAVKSVELEDGMAVGIGSGSTVVFAVAHLEKHCKELGSNFSVKLHETWIQLLDLLVSNIC